MVFPWVFPWFSHGFPMGFPLWISTDTANAFPEDRAHAMLDRRLEGEVPHSLEMIEECPIPYMGLNVYITMVLMVEIYIYITIIFMGIKLWW